MFGDSPHRFTPKEFMIILRIEGELSSCSLFSPNHSLWINFQNRCTVGAHDAEGPGMVMMSHSQHLLPSVQIPDAKSIYRLEADLNVLPPVNYTRSSGTYFFES